MAKDIEGKVIEWRRDIHQNPELSNREFETAKKIATHLKGLGIEVTENVAKTGVVSKKTASRKISRITKRIQNSKK